jgi:predicted MPP superfamily phosphohydrolase
VFSRHVFTKILYFTDAHNQPSLNMERFVWLAGLINDTRPDFIVDGGDFDDFQSLCSHERNETYKGKLKPSLERDLIASQEARDLLNNNILHDCPKFVTLGNHEARLWIYENSNPEIKGMPSGKYEQILKSTEWQFKPYGAYINIAGVDFTHAPFNAMGKPVGGDTGCKQIADKSIRDVCFGHTHKKDEWSAHKFGGNSVVAFNGGVFYARRLRA